VLDALCRISISRFYRDRGIFDELARALPPLAAQARQRGAARLRIWSAGCASGEEPYTEALLLAFRMLPDPCQAEIVATDADPHLLARARRACYPPGSLRELPPGWQAAAFNAVGEERCLRPAYRNAVRFLEQDIRRERPDEHFDLILCRNLVFTYFAVPLQMRTVARLADALVPDGLLLLGSHESLPQAVPGLITERPWLYRRQP
jgi:chemotaxis protein methyltransferase CheR